MLHTSLPPCRGRRFHDKTFPETLKGKHDMNRIATKFREMPVNVRLHMRRTMWIRTNKLRTETAVSAMKENRVRRASEICLRCTMLMNRCKGREISSESSQSWGLRRGRAVRCRDHRLLLVLLIMSHRRQKTWSNSQTSQGLQQCRWAYKMTSSRTCPSPQSTYQTRAKRPWVAPKWTSNTTFTYPKMRLQDILPKGPCNPSITIL